MQLEMSLSDVAALARVRRPVVSMWRSRAARTQRPFPSPLSRTSGRERFAAADIIDWLEQTRHGNHDDVRADAAAFASPPGLVLTGDARLFDGLTALLCLRAQTDQQLSGSDVQATAGRNDPGDEHLLREVAALGDDLSPMADYADQLAEASYGAAAALELLLGQRFRLRQAALVNEALHPCAIDLVTALGEGLLRTLDERRLVVTTVTAGDLVLPLAADGADVVLPRAARLARRRLRARGVAPDALMSLEKAGPALVLAVNPTDDELDELVVSLAEHQRALVLSPASHLVDALPTERGNRRAQSLRAGRVRAVVQLPAGLVTHRSRERLGLWVLGPDLTGRPLEDRIVAVADVSDAPLSGVVVDQLRDDVLAAMAPPILMRARSFAVASLVRTGTLLAQRGSLTAVLPGRGVAGKGALRSLPSGVAVSAGTNAARLPVTVDEAVRAREARVVSGNRDGWAFVPDGVQVLGVEELFGGAPRHVDRLAFLAQSSSRLTEPGDVVFCTSPRPRARVDPAGGSAVPFPARILRFVGADLSPQVVAHTINGLPDSSRAWRRWSLPRIAPEQVTPAGAALAAVQREQRELRARFDDLDESAAAIVRGLITGELAVTVTDPKDL